MRNQNDTPIANTGIVTLVGAGPGDPDLLTLKAVKAIQQAHVVLYDRLVDARVLEFANVDATLIETGKRAGQPGWSQHAINTAMVTHARDGKRVVRLKSGDPLIFGRADEEMDALDAAGIAFSIVPGITSAVAAATDAKVSLTRRGRNSSVRFITGHDTKGYAEQDWRGLSAPGATFAVYMGIKAVRFLQGRLLIHGAERDTPVTITQNISRPAQRRIDTTIGEMSEDMRAAQVSGPAVILVGLKARTAHTQDIEEFEYAETVFASNHLR